MERLGRNNQGLTKLTSVFMAAAFCIISACSNDKKHEEVVENPHTGNAEIEAEVTPVASQVTDKIKIGTLSYIYAERVRARLTPEVSETNLAGILDLNDQVSIMDPTPVGAEKFVKVEVKQSKGIKVGTIVYVSSKYLSTTKRVLKKEEAAQLKYFMVQNIATEKVRIYERGVVNGVYSNKMVFQADMVAGEDEDGTKTNVGIYRIDRWEKFYEDGAKKYPAWYRPNYPMVPLAGASRASWFESAFMPAGKGDARGAFGWYTAIVSPNANGQWTHGTMGWGADKDDFISFRNGFVGKVVNLFAAIRSHGCTRVDNETVAYIRHLLPVGSTVVKIYAREALLNVNLPGYSKDKPRWEYILTKSGYGKAGGQTADAATVMAQKTPPSEWIEQGQYMIDQYPVYHEGGNLYDIKDRAFQGLFLVDDGTLYGYEHPKGIDQGGYKDQAFPNYMIFKDSQGN